MVGAMGVEPQRGKDPARHFSRISGKTCRKTAMTMSNIVPTCPEPPVTFLDNYLIFIYIISYGQFLHNFCINFFEKVPIFNPKERFMAPRTFWPSVILTAFIGIATGCMDRLPYDFNGKVTRYPNSKIVHIMKLRGGCYAELETSDSWEKVLDYYKDRLGRSGWAIRVERQLEPRRTKDPDATAFLALFKGREGLMIDAHRPNHRHKTQVALFLGGIDG
jgi:hypothetical protein